MIGKRLNWTPQQQFGLAIFLLTASWINQDCYGAQAFGFLMIIFYIALLLGRRLERKSWLFMATIAFMALIMTHGLASFVALVSSVRVLGRVPHGMLS